MLRGGSFDGLVQLRGTDLSEVRRRVVGATDQEAMSKGPYVGGEGLGLEVRAIWPPLYRGEAVILSTGTPIPV